MNLKKPIYPSLDEQMPMLTVAAPHALASHTVYSVVHMPRPPLSPPVLLLPCGSEMMTKRNTMGVTLATPGGGKQTLGRHPVHTKASKRFSLGAVVLALTMAVSLPHVATPQPVSAASKAGSMTEGCLKGAGLVFGGHLLLYTLALAADLLGCAGVCTTAAVTYSATQIIPESVVGCGAGALMNTAEKEPEPSASNDRQPTKVNLRDPQRP